MVEVLQPFFKCYEASLYYMKTRSDSSSCFGSYLGNLALFKNWRILSQQTLITLICLKLRFLVNKQSRIENEFSNFVGASP